ncbi:zinc ribbon domain-containing protein [Clostridiaceae bacterium 35-E11]
MDFMDKLVQKVSEGTKVLSQKTDEIIEITELKVSMKKMEADIEEIKFMIGDLVYNYYLSNNTSIPTLEIKERCKEIQRLEQEVNRIKVRVNRLRGLAYCSSCGEFLEEEENYCPKCGHRNTRY